MNRRKFSRYADKPTRKAVRVPDFLPPPDVLRHAKVVISPGVRFLEPRQYQPQAQHLFESISPEIQSKLPSAQIEHIGSSSVKGLWSKGDLDIYVGVDPDQMSPAISALEFLGFKIKENSFRSDALCPFESFSYELDVGIQLIANGSEFENFLKFRDQLRSSRKLRNKYNQLKAIADGMDHDAYREMKSRFIERVLKDPT